MAEAIFAHLVEEAGLTDRFQIASAATGDWHVGEAPHRGTLDVLRRRGIPPIGGKRAQTVDTALLARADYVIAMTGEHVRELRAAYGGVGDGKASLLLDYLPNPECATCPTLLYRPLSGSLRSRRAGARALLEHICRREDSR
jgi:protein-tyrosine phosphatase